MKRLFVVAAFFVVGMALLADLAPSVAVRNAGFEEGLAGWNGCFRERKRAFLRSPL